MKVVFMGTPDFAVETLKAIAGAGHDIAAVVTQPDKPRGRSGALMFSAVKEEAVNLGIECILQPEKARDEAFIQQIRDINPDVIVVVAYGKILPKSLLDIPKYGCINVHASLLPKSEVLRLFSGQLLTATNTQALQQCLWVKDLIPEIFYFRSQLSLIKRKQADHFSIS